MLKHSKIKLDKIIKDIILNLAAINPYRKELPNGVKFLFSSNEADNKDSGFYARVYSYQDKIIIAYQETYILSLNDILSNLNMYINKL